MAFTADEFDEWFGQSREDYWDREWDQDRDYAEEEYNRQLLRED